ncbi:hypothetical protein [Defluviimonas sp. SAOS-178_SWC]|uniref:hypothetical protein n=1 Tax=Defluviimonas sp. SAOS-178_SWC TaxID=3121287 RepID=UPI003221F843
MLSIRQIAPALVAASLALAGGPGLAETASHQGHAAGEIALSLNAGQKWQGDENMHKGMDAIRQAVAARLDAIHEDRLPEEEYRALAATVMGQTDFMIENCDLEPETDAQLHIVLGQIIEGVSDMEESDAPRGGAVKVVMALNAYGEHFVHPGWQSLN